jgi:hypothetical protein
MIDWNSLTDGAVIGRKMQQQLVGKWGGRETSKFKQSVRFFDFESYGKPFTQVALVLEPETPLFLDGRRVVIVASEGGHDNGREFVSDYVGREGIGPWLAKRGVTFISLCRLGRWNLLSDEPLGSWIDVPLDQRMPVFHRGQKGHWPIDQYVVTGAEGVSSPTGSQTCRTARPGTPLHEHMAALTPYTSVLGFKKALEQCIDPGKRNAMQIYYWGFSTGGNYLWALSKSMLPDGILGYGMNNFAFSHFWTTGSHGKYDWLYDKSAARLRERGLPDFKFYTRDLTDEERERQWQVALHSPRFKSHEDTFMFFNAAALSQDLSELWRSDFLPEANRDRGIGELFRENFDLAFPDRSISNLAVLDLFGDADEINPYPKSSAVAASMTRGYCRKYKIALLEGRHHCIDADHAEAFGSLWLEAIENGYFK